jgi:signal transduction histidine kinase
VVHDLEIEIEEKKAKVTYDSLVKLKGYFRQLQQLFHNLIGNSLKYSSEDRPPEIHIFCSEVSDATKNYFVISVKDNGIGFEQKYAQNIFNVFTRLHGDTQYKGTGIGLSIVKKVMENHNGYVEAESQVGSGSVFKLYFPR